MRHEICNVIGITKARTTSYHPQCDGQTERQKRTLQRMLSSFVSSRRDDWDLWLDSITFAYNTIMHDSLVITPYDVVVGCAPRLRASNRGRTWNAPIQPLCTKLLSSLGLSSLIIGLSRRSTNTDNTGS